MDRVVAQLLAELDGVQASADTASSGASGSSADSNDIFIIGATNR